MGKIFYLMGKSASGKDAVYGRLIKDEALGLKPYVCCTTRPMRSGEQNGREYFFTTVQQLKEYEESGKLIEKRVYHTVYGDWFYYSVDSENVDLENENYLCIGTLESFVKMRAYYGAQKVIPLYMEVEDGERLIRAVNRERLQKTPGYKELCRRFITDSEDFSEERLKEAGIAKRFQNENLEECVNEIKKCMVNNAEKRPVNKENQIPNSEFRIPN